MGDTLGDGDTVTSSVGEGVEISGVGVAEGVVLRGSGVGVALPDPGEGVSDTGPAEPLGVGVSVVNTGLGAGVGVGFWPGIGACCGSPIGVQPSALTGLAPMM